MPLDPVLVTDTQSWFRKAAIDLRAAEVDLSAVPPILEDAVFHCQQAVEKSMKGFLTFHQVSFGKTHDLRRLGRLCLSIDTSLEADVEVAIPLTAYAWEFRYPGNPDEPLPAEAHDALRVGHQVFDELMKRLPAEMRLA